MKAKPLPKTLFSKLKKAKVTEVTLRWMGGSDEANLDVFLRGATECELPLLLEEVELWAWEVYSYSGAGDGTDYGDDVVYDLVKGEVSTQERQMLQRQVWPRFISGKDINKLEVK